MFTVFKEIKKKLDTVWKLVYLKKESTFFKCKSMLIEIENSVDNRLELLLLLFNQSCPTL